MAGEKTEKATPKRKSDERKKGNIFQSREVVTVLSLMVVFAALGQLYPHLSVFLERSIKENISLASTTDLLTQSDVRKLYIDSLLTFGITTMPLLLISAGITILATIAQTRGLVSTKSMAFKGSRLNPIQGFKKMFSMRGLIELLKSILKIVVLSYIIWNELKKQIPLLPRMMDMDFRASLQVTGGIIYSIVKTSVIIFAFLAGFDYFYQWWDYEKNLRMSKQEIKEEYKQTEGDPQIKGKIKERQQSAARRRMMQNVPKADVVIRNPTHYAVAIGYDPEKNNAPVVLAKGIDHIALKIVEIAEQHEIVVTENRPLARGLYDAVDLDREIPDQYYQAVAEVLAFVYSLKKKELK